MVIFSSCSTTHFYTGFTPNDAMDGMMLLGPCSVQYYIDQQNKEAYDDSLSLASEALINSLVEDIGLPISRRVQLTSEQTEETIAFMNFIMAQKQELRGDYLTPALLDDLLEAKGERYGLLIYANGMTRDNKGYAKDVANGIIMGLATAVMTMGTMSVYGNPVKFSSNIYAAILDSETDHIVFYNLSNPKESHPLKSNSVRRQLEKIFKDFLK